MNNISWRNKLVGEIILRGIKMFLCSNIPRTESNICVNHLRCFPAAPEGSTSSRLINKNFEIRRDGFWVHLIFEERSVTFRTEAAPVCFLKTGTALRPFLRT